MKSSWIKRTMSLFLAGALSVSMLAGCSQNETDEETQAASDESQETVQSAVVAEAGTPLEQVDPTEIIATIGEKEIPASEVFYVYYLMKTGLEQSAGISDWGTELYSGYTYADYMKTLVENQVVTFEYLDSMMDDYDVSLTDEEEENAVSEVQTFLDSMPDEYKDAFGFNEENIREMYVKTFLTNKVYSAYSDEVESNLTDEELADCKFKEVQHILISTRYTETTQTSEDSEETEDTTAEAESFKEDQKKVAEEVLQKVNDGENFETLADEYTADSGVTYYVNEKGQTPDGSTMVSEFTDAVNQLHEGEVSGLVETEYGYHIIKCISEDNQDAADQAISTLVASKIQENYSTWLSENEVSFTDVWQNYPIVNPDVSDETSEESSESSESDESQSETEAETETEAE